MLPKYSNKGKGKGILVSDEVVVDIFKQLSTIINNAYEYNLGWWKEEHKIKIDALFYAQEDDCFQKASEEHQLEFMLELVDKLEHEKLNRIGPFYNSKKLNQERKKQIKLVLKLALYHHKPLHHPQRIIYLYFKTNNQNKFL